MNNVEKTITKAQLKLEQRALKELKKSYEKAKHDIEIQISALNSRKDMQNLQSIIYQKKYQEILLKQIEGVIDDLNKGQYETLQNFFEGAYATGYIGSMYDLQSQGIPLTVPIDPKKMERAVKTDSKLSKNYYQNRFLPENLSTMRRNIRLGLTRGIASGKTWVEVAYQVASGMNSPLDRAMRDAMRIIRTEGHRINQQGFLDASLEAKKKGADVVKQWDSTLDGNTRPAHRIADGQIKELDEPFIVDGEKMDAPSIGGSAKNVCNCRCQLLQRARWALDEVELKTLQDRANFFGLDKSQDFNDFRKKYLQLPKNADKIKIGDSSTIMDMEDFNSYMKYMKDNFNVTVSKDMKNLYFDGVKKINKRIY
ncbi:MAG: phage minor head protein [Eubacteriales bacterium]|nr:phage minor head protein [Eubacteriales bacterium]